MGKFTRFDIYSKGVQGIEVKTSAGGVITVVSLCLVGFLFLSEFVLFCTVDVVNRMHVDTKTDEIVNMDIDIIFLHEDCTAVEMNVHDSKGNPDVELRNKMRIKPYGTEGCRFYGELSVKKVAGEIRFMHQGLPNLFNLGDFLTFNSTHIINHLTLGPRIPKLITPLVEVHKTVLENAAAYKYFIKAVPTTYFYLFGSRAYTYQYSVTEHRKMVIENSELSLPGVIFAYDFSPIRVEYIETKPSILQFLTSTSAIIGGVVAVAGMVDRFVYRVSQKVD